MTVISFADEYRKRVGLRIRYLTLDGRPMTKGEFDRIAIDDTSDDAGEVMGFVNLCPARCLTRKKKHKHIVWQRDEDGALRISTYRPAHQTMAHSSAVRDWQWSRR